MMETNQKLDYSKITNVEIDGIDPKDYPDFCDAYISDAMYDGAPMTDEQIQQINEDSQFVYDCVIKHIF